MKRYLFFMIFCILLFGCTKISKDYRTDFIGEYKIHYSYHWQQYNNPDPPYYYSTDTLIIYNGLINLTESNDDEIDIELPSGSFLNVTLSENGGLIKCDSIGLIENEKLILNYGSYSPCFSNPKGADWSVEITGIKN